MDAVFLISVSVTERLPSQGSSWQRWITRKKMSSIIESNEHAELPARVFVQELMKWLKDGLGIDFLLY